MKKTILLFCFSFLLITQLANAQTQLWGMAPTGGANNGGVIFKINLGGTNYDTVYSFNPDTVTGGGDVPDGDLFYAPNGKLYGTTIYGGINSGEGSIFSFDPSKNIYTDVHNFNFATGYQSNGSLVLANDGNLFGMASVGGAHNFGVIYRFNPDSNTYKDVYDFDSITGSYPYGKLLQATDGQLYGMTTLGGDSNVGVLFSFNPLTNNFSKLFEFNNANGIYPNASLIQIANKLYGLTSYGGSNGDGVLFSFNISTHFYTNLYSFNADSGYAPEGNLLTVSSDSALYGTTYLGGTNSNGVIFSFDTLTGIYHDLFNFNEIMGQYPPASLILASDDNLYGMTSRGGKDSDGVIFSFNPTNSDCNDVFNFNDTLGQDPNGDLIEINTTGIKQLATNKNQLLIYPNPASTQFTVISKQSTLGEIRVINIMGQVVYSSVGSAEEYSKQIDVSALPPGMYFVSVTSGSQIITNKISVISR